MPPLRIADRILPVVFIVFFATPIGFGQQGTTRHVGHADCKSADQVLVFDSPKRKHIRGSLACGEQVEIVADEHGWLHVRSAGNLQGYVWFEFISDGQRQAGGADGDKRSCPIEILKFDGAADVFWLPASQHRIALRIMNVGRRRIVGLKFRVVSYDATMDPHELLEPWVWDVDVQPGKVHEARLDVSYGIRGTVWDVALLKARFEDGTVADFDKTPCGIFHSSGYTKKKQ